MTNNLNTTPTYSLILKDETDYSWEIIFTNRFGPMGFIEHMHLFYLVRNNTKFDFINIESFISNNITKPFSFG